MSNDTVERLIAILVKQTGGDASKVTGESTLESMGIDSFDFIEFLFFVEDEFNVDIEAHFTDIGKSLKTVNDVAAAVESFVLKKQQGQESSSAPVDSTVAVA